MSQLKTFRKGGRTWAYQSTPSGKTINIYYETNLTGARRVANKFGEQYTGNENGRFYVLVSGYEKQQGGSWRYGPYPPGLETANGNASQVQSIGADVGLKQQITGSAPQNSSTTNPNQPGTQGTSTPTQTSQDQSTGESDAYLKYPIRMKDDQDRIMFQAYDYKSSPRLGGLANVKPKLSSPIGQKVGPVIFLPIQSSITDQNAVGWEPDTLNSIEMYAANASLRVMNNNSNVTQVASDEFTKALENLRSSSSQVRTYLAGQAIAVNNLLSRLNGQILNPNLELLFQGTQLRPFNFTFKLSPRSKNEAIVVKKIIRYFKENMAPIVGDQGLFLEAPNVFKIQYQYKKGTIHPGLNLIKECALTNCSVDYTPNGTYMTYPEGTMVSYTLTLQFQELEPVYSRDYKEGDGASHPIGF